MIIFEIVSLRNIKPVIIILLKECKYQYCQLFCQPRIEIWQLLVCCDENESCSEECRLLGCGAV
jgi:hypothetical protein